MYMCLKLSRYYVHKIDTRIRLLSAYRVDPLFPTTRLMKMKKINKRESKWKLQGKIQDFGKGGMGNC